MIGEVVEGVAVRRERAVALDGACAAMQKHGLLVVHVHHPQVSTCRERHFLAFGAAEREAAVAVGIAYGGVPAVSLADERRRP